MADVKISGLPASTTPLAGTEVLPIVQGGQTRQVSVANLTAGRAVSATDLTLTGVATVPAGTAAAPSITTTGDTNTGIFFPAADTIAFTEGGVEAMRINSSGNVGIGTTSPVVKLDIYGTGGALSAVNPPLQVWDTTALAANIGGGIAFGGNYTGTTKTNWAGIAGLKDNATDNNYSGYLAFYTRTNGSGNAERMRIDSAGNVGIGVTPNAWDTNSKNIQLTAGSIYSYTTAELAVAYNAYYTQGAANWTYKNTNLASRFSQASGEFKWFTAPSGTAGTAITFTESMRLDSSGILGLGVTPSAWGSSYKVLQGPAGYSGSYLTTVLEIGQNAFDASAGVYKYVNSAAASKYSQSGGAHSWSTAPSGTAGNALSWTTSMGLDASGNLTISGATATKASGTTWSNPSDIRLKDNISNYSKGLAELMQINVKEWTYNGKGNTTEGMKGLGVIADEVMKVLPNTVDNYQVKLNVDDEDETDVKKFDATEITWLMLNSIKEQQAIIADLKANFESYVASHP